VKKRDKESVERRIWVVRPGRKTTPKQCSENEQVFSEKGIAGLRDDYLIGDLRKGGRTRGDMIEFVASSRSQKPRKAIISVVSNLFRLLNEMRIGDWVLSPSRIARVYRVGIVDSAYRFEAKAAFQHIRDVKWMGEFPKGSLSIEARRELGAARLFFECKRNTEEVSALLESVIKGAIRK
jgi:restriction system protein